MTNFSPGDEVRYTSNRDRMMYEGFAGALGTVIRQENPGGVVEVNWHTLPDEVGRPSRIVYADNIELVTAATDGHESVPPLELRPGDEFTVTVKGTVNASGVHVSIGCKTFSLAEIADVATAVTRKKRPVFEPKPGEVYHGVFRGQAAAFAVYPHRVNIVYSDGRIDGWSSITAFVTVATGSHITNLKLVIDADGERVPVAAAPF